MKIDFETTLKSAFISIYHVMHILLFFCLLFTVSCRNKAPEGKQTNEPTRLITYNVWYGFTKVPDRKKAWIKWIKNQQPDILSLQELNAYTTDQLTKDASQWDHPYTVLLKEDGFPTGITSRYPIEDIQCYQTGFHHGLIRVKIKGIYIYVIHLHPSNWAIRHQEIDLIIKNLQELPSGASILLAGDFNTFSRRDTLFYNLERLTSFFHHRDIQFQEKNLDMENLDFSAIEKITKFGLIDLEYYFRPPGYTFTGSFPTLVEKEGEHGDARRLDYVFASVNLKDQIEQARIIADSNTLYLSDHLPMIVDFNLP